jgi:hypothetical protein
MVMSIPRISGGRREGAFGAVMGMFAGILCLVVARMGALVLCKCVYGCVRVHVFINVCISMSQCCVGVFA